MVSASYMWDYLCLSTSYSFRTSFDGDLCSLPVCGKAYHETRLSKYRVDAP